MTTTRELLAPFLEADTPLGDLARDAAEDPDLPEEPERLLGHLASRNACQEARSAAWQLLALAGLTGDRMTAPGRREQHAMTPERKAVFLERLAATGSTVAAAEAATPWATGGRGGVQSFYDERARDVEFADAWKRAEAAALAAVESEITRRAFEPERRPVFSKGVLVGQHETYDNRLLLSLARRLNPEAWSERKQLEVSGQVDHNHRHGHVVVSLEARDVLLLPEADRPAFMALLEKIATAKEEPDAIEHKPE